MLKIFKIFIDILFNRRCLVCFKYGSYICNNCFFKFIGRNQYIKCHVCNTESRIGLVHLECRELSHLDGLISLSSYTPLLRDLIFKVKYQFIYQIFNDLGDIFSEYLKSYSIFKDNKGIQKANKVNIGENKLIVTSVPLSKRKQNFRGFNQSEVLAKKISRNLNLKYLKLLNRVKDTKALHSQDKLNRKESIYNAFEINKKVNKLDNLNLSNKDIIIIIDDIYTSGATLNECAKVLKQRYNCKVFGAVLARV